MEFEFPFHVGPDDELVTVVATIIGTPDEPEWDLLFFQDGQVKSWEWEENTVSELDRRQIDAKVAAYLRGLADER